MATISFRRFMVVGLCLLGVSCLTPGAGASPIVSVSGEGLANAAAAEAAFLGGLTSFTTESFEGFTPVDKQVSFATSVGSFMQIQKGNEIASCTTAPVSGCTGLVDLNAGTTPFSGRFATGGHQWLDSNDSKTMLFKGAQTWDSIGFYITDANDVGANVTLNGYDGSDTLIFSVDLFGGADLNSGKVYYITVQDPGGIQSLKFLSDSGSRNDGFGIDLFTVGATTTVPEPASLLLLGAGLLGLAAWRRHSVQA